MPHKPLVGSSNLPLATTFSAAVFVFLELEGRFYGGLGLGGGWRWGFEADLNLFMVLMFSLAFSRFFV
jgi:hypothetical protein